MSGPAFSGRRLEGCAPQTPCFDLNGLVLERRTG
ncbi:hypothetical protein SMCF_7032 [Streptomyces coelicoflavus ZG0656]|nr:hypothetical protein SMCF_7032 [Streptomyces coelicoflavus ZG0656]